MDEKNKKTIRYLPSGHSKYDFETFSLKNEKLSIRYLDKDIMSIYCFYSDKVIDLYGDGTFLIK